MKREMKSTCAPAPASCSHEDLARCLRDARAEVGGALIDVLAIAIRHLRQVERLRKSIPGRAIRYDAGHVVHDVFLAREQMRSAVAKVRRAVNIADALGNEDARARAGAHTSSRKTTVNDNTRRS